jgi:uncharacterized protein
LSAAIVGLLLWSAIRLRRKAHEFRDEVRERAGAMLPESRGERRWFAAVGIGGAISEEMLFRGFLFYYIGTHVPAANDLEKAILTSVVFAAGHLYQGWRGLATSTAAGLILAALYISSGSLLLPVVVHAIGNLRGILIFSRRKEAGPASL